MKFVFTYYILLKGYISSWMWDLQQSPALLQSALGQLVWEDRSWSDRSWDDHLEVSYLSN